MIDWQRVADLRDEIGADDFAEVVPLFLEEVSSVTAALRAGPDLSRLEEDLHYLKGSALNLGFSAFAELCGTGERAAAAGLAHTVDVAQILECFDASCSVFDTGLSEGKAV